MADYDVVVSPKAERQIKDLQQAEARKVLKALQKLQYEPRPRGAEKLSQCPCFWRVRVGDYRIIYAIEESEGSVVIALVRHRKDAYRDLGKLDPGLVAETLRARMASLRDI